ncbi:MAG: LysR family transcriptional regulator [Pigmentiphaga sp.]|nr:LysR family transcriptional regulator [Pigmentiphaga sp.]
MNLLPILAELLRYASVTKAANRLNLTQSTVSGALRQLREIFQDELLLQKGRSMVLTERATRLLPDVERVMDLASRLLQSEDFVPAEAKTQFRIATADYVSAIVTSKLGSMLREVAPSITLNLVPTPGTSGKELQLGTLDLIICPNLDSNWRACGISQDDAGFGHEIVMQDDFVGIQWSGHPSHEKTVDSDEYFARPHAMYCRTDGQDTIEQEVLNQLNLTQKVQFQVPYFTLLPQLVVGTDLISLVPRSLAVKYSRMYSISLFQPPIELPRMDLVMIWLRSREAHDDLAWLRQTISEAALKIE